MPIINMSGSLPQQSSREKSTSLRPEVQDKVPVLDGHALSDERVVENTFINETSVNEDAYRERMSLVAGFPEGRIVVVTYFSQNNPLTDIQSHVVDLNATTKDDTHLSFTEIRNFELRCSSDINYEYDSDSNTSKVTGEAIVFPRFTPRIADIFLYEMRQGQIGVFRVASVDRLALGQDTYHKITFTMQNYLTPEYRNMLRRQSTSAMYFDKKKYLAGNTALLSSKGFSEKKTLEHLRLELIEDYIERFYSNEFSTFMRPDGLYDPYVVEYWNKKVSIKDSIGQMRPTQILISVSNYRKTIWAALTNNPIKDLANIEKSWDTDTYNSTFWGVNITSLLGHKFITIGSEAKATNSYTIDNNGDPILMDASPYFHNLRSHEDMDNQIVKDFVDARYQVYGDYNTFQKCPPHAHGANTPEANDICYPDKCQSCKFDHCGNPCFIPEPPFPIMSNDQLRDIYLAFIGIDPTKTPISDTVEAQIRGYISWYRNTYPGTLSRVELKVLWAEESGIDPDKELTTEEETAFNKYVASYRSRFLAVLTDRQIEFIFRMNHHIEDVHPLTTEEIAELVLVIVDYRRKHGYPDENSNSELGIPIGEREAGAVMYDHTIILEAPTATDLINLEYNTEGTNVEVDFTKNIPEVFKPKEHVASSKHCHTSICHFLCGAEAKQREEAKKKQQELDEKSHYGLSSAFYNGSGAMDPFERLVYDSLTNKDINPEEVLNAVSMYKSWEDEDAFYRHLFSLYIIDKALYWLMYH